MTPDWTSKVGQKNPDARHSAQSDLGNQPERQEFAVRVSAKYENFLRALQRLLVGAAGLGFTAAIALTPLPKPVASTEVDAGQSAPFAGAWSVTVPTIEADMPDSDYAICTLPVRIKAADETHIFYLGPSEVEADAAMELVPDQGGARWEAIAGGPTFFAVWINPDTFYLCDTVPETEADWAMPFVYRRCP